MLATEALVSERPVAAGVVGAGAAASPSELRVDGQGPGQTRERTLEGMAEG